MSAYVDDQSSPRAIHLFAGAGGGILGGMLLGWRTVCAVEIDTFCREVLVSRQNDGSLDPFPIWDDVRTFDGLAWRGRCDILCGGFPCQNVSPLGDRTGIRGDKSCLWCEFARIIADIQPRLVFVENSADLIKLGLDVLLQDLDSLGYDAEWECLSAAELGAPHIRDRIWILAKKRGFVIPEYAKRHLGKGGVDPMRIHFNKVTTEEVRVLADPDVQRCKELGISVTAASELYSSELQSKAGERRYVQCKWWENEPGIRRVADGVAYRVDRLGALGNGQVSYVAARSFCDLLGRV